MATDDFDWRKRIMVEPDVRFGRPCVRDTRISVYDILDWIAAGMTFDEIYEDFTELTHEDIRGGMALMPLTVWTRRPRRPTVRFLIDNNLSPRLRKRSPELLADALHARDLGGRGRASDGVIWQRGVSDELVILTKDHDFVDLARERGHPPKVIRLLGRNASTAAVAARLAANLTTIRAFLADPNVGLLEID